MSQEELLWGIGLPALVCGTILVAVFRPWRNSGGAGASWGGANALAAGFVTAYLVAHNWQLSLPPRQAWEWLVYLSAGAAIAVAYGVTATSGWTIWGLAAGLSAYLLVGPRVDQFWAWRGLTAGMMIASMAALDRLQGRAGSAVFALTLSLVAAACWVILRASRNEMLAQMAGALSACLGVVAILGWWRPSMALGGGGVLVAGLLLPGLMMSAYFHGGKVPAWCLVLAAVAPAAYWLAELPAAKRFVTPRPLLMRVGAILAAAGVAMVGALFMS